MSVTCVFLYFGSRVEEPPLSLCFSTLAFDIDMAIGYSAAHNMTVNPIWHELWTGKKHLYIIIAIGATLKVSAR